MKKLILAALMTLSAWASQADILYFWINNDDMRYSDLSKDLFVTVSWFDKGTQHELDAPVIKSDAIIQNILGSTTVYEVDTRNLNIRNNPELTFLIELDNFSGTDYYASYVEQHILQNFNINRHYYAGVTMQPYAVPEPSSGILMVFGVSLIMLRRKRDDEK